MKKFFAFKKTDELQALYQDLTEYQLPWEEEALHIHRTVNQMVAMLLDSIRVFYQFAYTPWPQPRDLSTLLIARRCILSVSAFHQWQLEPTVHYMTSHAIDFVKEDMTSYSTLQEAVEHQNFTDKQDSKTTMKFLSSGNERQSCWKQILQRQELKRILVEDGYGHDPFCLYPVNSVYTAEPGLTITPPLYCAP